MFHLEVWTAWPLVMSYSVPELPICAWERQEEQSLKKKKKL